MNSTETRIEIEKYETRGEKLLGLVKELIKEGNVRRITVRNEEGKSIVEVPLTVGVVGAALAPPLAAVGAVAALLADCSIEVERHPAASAAIPVVLDDQVPDDQC
jgi:hypothetical protein